MRKKSRMGRVGDAAKLDVDLDGAAAIGLQRVGCRAVKNGQRGAKVAPRTRLKRPKFKFLRSFSRLYRESRAGQRAQMVAVWRTLSLS